MPTLTTTRRRLPHWSLEGSWYYVTWRLEAGVLTTDEVLIVRDHILAGDHTFYRLIALCVMPDHVHVIVRPNESFSISRVMKGIKGVSARKLNSQRVTRGSIWQPESWDRILRDESEFLDKFNYMLMNSVVEKLTEDLWSYPGWYCEP